MQSLKKVQGPYKVDWKIGTSSLANVRIIQGSDYSGDEAVLKSGGMIFQAFVSSAWQESVDKRMTGVWVVLHYIGCFHEHEV